MSYDEIFDRVSKLVENVSTKSASIKRAADEDNTEEYNAWSEVEAKDKKFLKAVDEILSEAVPASPTNTEEAEEGTESELQAAYPTTEVSSAGEGNVDAEVESAVQGVKEIKESTLKRASDHTLARAFNRLSRDLVSYIAAQDSSVKNAALNDVDSISAVCVADLVKQAQFDASLVFGYLSSVKAAAGEEGEGAAHPLDASDEEVEAVAEALVDNLEKAVEDTPETDSAVMAQDEEEALKQIQDLIKSVPESELDAVISAVVEESPEAALQAVKENPEVADALIDALSNSSNMEIDDLKDVLSKEEAAEGPEEDEEEPEGVQKLEDALGTEKHGAFAQLSALDAAMQELGITPEDIELSVAGTAREDEGIKVASAVREFRKKPASKLANSNAKLRIGFKQYLRDLMFGS